MKDYFKVSILSICLAILASAFIACKKQTKIDTQKPSITLVEPTEDTLELSIEPEIHIEFTLSDNEQLQSLQVNLVDSNGITLFTETPNVSGFSVYPFHAHITPSISLATPMELQIIASDKNQNIVTMIKTFVVMP